MVEFSLRHPEHFEQKPKVAITFAIKYKTEFGQIVSIVGDHKKIGKWTDLSIGSMKWSEGDIWKVTI